MYLSVLANKDPSIHVHGIDTCMFPFQRQGSSPYSSGDIRSGLGIVEQAQSSDSMVRKIILYMHVQLYIYLLLKMYVYMYVYTCT